MARLVAGRISTLGYVMVGVDGLTITQAHLPGPMFTVNGRAVTSNT